MMLNYVFRINLQKSSEESLVINSIPGVGTVLLPELLLSCQDRLRFIEYLTILRILIIGVEYNILSLRKMFVSS